MSYRKPLFFLAAAATLVGLAGCAANGDASDPAASAAAESTLGTEADPIRLAVSGASDPQWPLFVEAAEAEGIYVDVVDFTEYSLQNPALAEGEVDANQFQHILYLANYNVEADDDIQSIGSTAIFPLGLYSEEFTSVDQIPDGSTIAIPNDTVNQARALLVLQSAGLLELEGGGSAASTPEDIVEENSTVEVTTMDASLTVTTLPDVAGAVINNNFVETAGIDPSDAIYADDPSDPSAAPYINIFATTAENVDNEAINALVDIYQNTQAVKDAVLANSGGTAIFAEIPKEELQSALAETEEAIRSAG